MGGNFNIDELPRSRGEALIPTSEAALWQEFGLQRILSPLRDSASDCTNNTYDSPTGPHSSSTSSQTEQPHSDPDLQRVINDWETLGDPIKAAILALVETATATHDSGRR